MGERAVHGQRFWKYARKDARRMDAERSCEYLYKRERARICRIQQCHGRNIRKLRRSFRLWGLVVSGAWAQRESWH